MSTRRYRTGKVLVNKALLIDRMLTFLETTGSSGTQLPGMGFEVALHSSSRFLFEEVDFLIGDRTLTEVGAIIAVVLVLEDVDAREAAMMDMLTVGAVFVDVQLVLLRCGRTGCVERKPCKVVVERWASVLEKTGRKGCGRCFYAQRLANGAIPCGNSYC